MEKKNVLSNFRPVAIILLLLLFIGYFVFDFSGKGTLDKILVHEQTTDSSSLKKELKPVETIPVKQKNERAAVDSLDHIRDINVTVHLENPKPVKTHTIKESSKSVIQQPISSTDDMGAVASGVVVSQSTPSYSPFFIKARIYGDQTINSGSTVELEVIEPFNKNGVTYSPGDMITGNAEFKNDRIFINGHSKHSFIVCDKSKAEGLAIVKKGKVTLSDGYGVLIKHLL